MRSKPITPLPTALAMAVVYAVLITAALGLTYWAGGLVMQLFGPLQGGV